MVKLWKLVGEGSERLTLPDMSSLDAVTRQLPDGFYSTFRTYGGRTHVLDLEAHLDRLYQPAARLALRPSVTRPALRRCLASLLRGFTAGEARLRLMLAAEDRSGMIHVAIEALQLLPPGIYQNGVKVVTTSAHRAHPALKSTNFIGESQVERKRLARQAAFEGLMLRNGRILEGLTSNFFYLIDGKLGTARRGVLNGVTRRQVLRLASEAGMPVVLHALPLSRISRIDEAFLTSSSRGIVPIVAIDDQTVGAGGVGQGTRKLMQAYGSDIERRAKPLIDAR